MKLKILQIVFAAALAMVSGVTAYQAQDKEVMSDLALANVEALARGEGNFGICISARNQTCQYYVVTPGGNHVETYFDQRVAY